MINGIKQYVKSKVNLLDFMRETQNMLKKRKTIIKNKWLYRRKAEIVNAKYKNACMENDKLKC